MLTNSRARLRETEQNGEYHRIIIYHYFNIGFKWSSSIDLFTNLNFFIHSDYADKVNPNIYVNR